MKGYHLVILSILLFRCESLIIDDDPKNDYKTNFEIFWTEFDQHYSYFELKTVDWDSVYVSSMAEIPNIQNDLQFRELLSEIVLSLEDGHVNLFAGSFTARFDYQDGFPENDPAIAERYLLDFKSPNPTISYGMINGYNLGYIRIKDFQSNGSNYFIIDDILETFSDTEGIVLDVRSNGGGSDTNSKRISSRFADEKRLYRRVRYRNGPSRSDFTKWYDDYISPEGNMYKGKVAVLTNRTCYSSTEDFILAMRAFPKVTTIGGITGGGSGNPIHRELPNGWYFRLSSWQLVDHNFESYEGVGLHPDVLVNISEDDLNDRRDTILEAAIQTLLND